MNYWKWPVESRGQIDLATGGQEIDARVIDTVDGIDYDYWPCPTTFSPDDITTRQIQNTGTVRLNYTKVCEVQPHSPR